VGCRSFCIVGNDSNLYRINCYAYCASNSVMRIDPTGEIWWVIALVVVCVLALVSCTPTSTELIEGASPYVEVEGSDDPNSPNCYAYAIGASVNMQPGEISGVEVTHPNDVDDVADSVMADLRAMGFTIRKISGPNAKIESNEWRIALMVGTSPFAFDGNGSFIYDYHFMVQTNTGQWAEKHGIGGTSILHKSGLTPNHISWDLGQSKGYYDSEIIYYAVGRS